MVMENSTNFSDLRSKQLLFLDNSKKLV